jgi:hypothetical protein
MEITQLLRKANRLYSAARKRMGAPGRTGRIKTRRVSRSVVLLPVLPWMSAQAHPATLG